MGPFDFFIAYAGPDQSQAKKLAWDLQDQHCQVFLDALGLAPGTPWPGALQEALEASRATLVLISSHSDAAFYQREEIARAIQLARDDPLAHRVIPVIIEKPSSSLHEMPYGSGILQPIDGTRAGGLERVAHTLAELLAAWDSATPSQTHLSSVEYHAFGAALRLDRAPQWVCVLEESQLPGHVLFLLHGPRRQNVGLFIERIQHFFSEAVEKHHAIYRVPFKWEGVSARCGADWQRHLRFVLGGDGDAPQLLASAARNQAVFLILGLQPLDLSRLEEAEQLALREFIVQRIPDLLRQARPRNSVRILLALDYADDPPADALLPTQVERVDLWGQEAAASRTLRHCLLPPAELPPWQDVQAYLFKVQPRPSPETMHQLRTEYEELTCGRGLGYLELADMINRYLRDA